MYTHTYELPAIEEGVIAQLNIDLIPDDFGKTGGYYILTLIKSTGSILDGSFEEWGICLGGTDNKKRLFAVLHDDTVSDLLKYGVAEKVEAFPLIGGAEMLEVVFSDATKEMLEDTETEFVKAVVGL